MISRMHIVIVPRNQFHALQVGRDGFPGKIPHLFPVRTGIERIGSMCDERHGRILPEVPESLHVRHIDSFGPASPGIAGKKSKRICSNGSGHLSHGQIPFGSRQMAANMKCHKLISFLGLRALPARILRQDTGLYKNRGL